MSEEKESFKIGPRTAWAFVIVFAALISLPPILRNVFADWKPAPEFFQRASPEAVNHLGQKKKADPRIERESPNFIDHREAWEKKLDDTPFSKPPRRFAQQLLSAGFREGNRQVVIGKDGWLFFRPAIDSLTGYGPLRAEPDSVAKDPSRPPWAGPRLAILEFGKQLDELGVELVLVPIPVKPMIYPEKLGLDSAAGPLRHPDASGFFAELKAAGIEVLDITDAMHSAKEKGDVFLKQDTHWTPFGLEIAAKEIAQFVQSRPWFAELETREFEQTKTSVAHTGDLVDKLDLATPRFEPEAVEIQQLLKPEIRDRDSPVVLLGDSFTNIFSASEMNWGKDGGFAERLSAKLGISIDTIAQNGQASTGVRRTLASRRGSAREMREKKKIVIWAIAARDLFLSETVARETQVEWQNVAFNDAEPRKPVPPGAIVVKAEMTDRHPLPDPNTVNYPSAIYAAKYRVLEVLEGEFGESEVTVFLWGFRDKKLLPSAEFQPGDQQILTLVPFDQKTELQTLRQLNDYIVLDLFWAENAESADER